MPIADERYLHPAAGEQIPARWGILCLECGVRLWARDLPIHDKWHDRLSVPEENK